MTMQREEVDVGVFEAFVARSEAKLQTALTATYGAQAGRVAALDAFSWAWEHWPRVQAMQNPLGYLYRVGQTSARRHRVRPIPTDVRARAEHEMPEINPELMPALEQLSVQQRTAVMLVHAFGWTVRDVAATLDVAPSTIQTHLERGLVRLRQLLETTDAI